MAPLSTDRPDTADASMAVPLGALQIEMGILLERSAADAHGFFTPLLFRYGLAPNLELRLASDGMASQAEGHGPTETGFAGAALGLKWNFLPARETGAVPSLGLLVEADLPAGTRPFRPRRVEPTLLLAADFALPRALSLGTNAGLRIRPGDGTPNQWLWAASLSHGLGRRTSLFLETAGSSREESAGKAALSLAGGILFLLGPNQQLDLAAVRGLRAASPDWSLLVGLTLRFLR